MSTHIKICGITNPEDAIDAAQAGADYLGLIFVDTSPRSVQLDVAKDIVTQVRQQNLKVKPKIVGVFQNLSLSEMQNIIQTLQLNYAQLHGYEPVELCQKLSVPVIKTILLENNEEALISKIQTYQPINQHNIFSFLFDLPKTVTGTVLQFPWSSRVKENLKESPYFLAGKLQANNVMPAIQKFEPLGVDVASGVEREPGQKCVEKMHDFCQVVRSEKVLN